jgi:uncharacterized protein
MRLGSRLRARTESSAFHRRARCDVDKARRGGEEFWMTTSRSSRHGTALITGASSGLGAEFARIFAADGHDLVLVARRERKLQLLAAELSQRHGVGARVIAADLARPAAPTEIVDRLRGDAVEVDYLVNNAGFGHLGPFVSTDRATELQMIQVNVVAPTDLARLLLPSMVARGYGRVLNVASTAAFVPGPFMAVYYATKAYVLSLSQALSNELRGTGVTVTVLCPGPTQTGFAAAAGTAASAPIQRHMVMDAASVARAGYRGMRRGQATVVPGLVNKLLTQSTRLIPRSMQAEIARRVAERRTHA